MHGVPEADHEADLAVFYDRQAPVRNTRALTPHRVECREWFTRLLKEEHRHSVFELGCGTGVEGLEFVRAGLHYTGVDLSSESVHVAPTLGSTNAGAVSPNAEFLSTRTATWRNARLLRPTCNWLR